MHADDPDFLPSVTALRDEIGDGPSAVHLAVGVMNRHRWNHYAWLCACGEAMHERRYLRHLAEQLAAANLLDPLNDGSRPDDPRTAP